jgi:hypothetical protein
MVSLPLRRRVLPATAIIAGLAGCAGGQAGTAGIVPSAPAPATRTAVSPLAGALMFTANRDGGRRHNGGLLAFHLTANGDVKPAVSISGSNTTLSNPDSLAIDSSHYIYAADDGGTQVDVFAPNAHGNVAPARVIGGSKSNLGPTEGLMIDSARHLWVTSYAYNDVTEYAANARGNVAPMNTIGGSKTQLNSPTGMAMNAAGQLFVANAHGASITVYAKGASGNATPVGVIAGSNTGLLRPFALAFDRNGRLLVADESTGLLVFASGALGDVSPLQEITSVSYADGVMTDTSNDIYVADWGHKAIEEFASSANGNATPLRSIQGSKTGLNGPNFLSFQ